MAHTKNAVVVDRDGVVVMVVIVDDDSQLSDPAFHPAGHLHIQINHVEGAHVLDHVAAAAALHPDLDIHHP